MMARLIARLRDWARGFIPWRTGTEVVDVGNAAPYIRRGFPMSSRRDFLLDVVRIFGTLSGVACTKRRAATLPTTPTMHSVRSRDGTVIAFSRSGSGDPLVMVHGTSSDKTRWRMVLPQLESHFTVYAIDRRGRGDSGDTQPYALEREFEDVGAVLESIDGPMNLFGHSHGAICALEAASRTTKIKRLVLYEPPINMGPPMYSPGTLRRLRDHLKANDRESVLRTFFTEIVRMPPHELQKMQEAPNWPARVAAAHTLVREVEVADTYRLDEDRVRRVTVPTLLLLGGDSPQIFRLPIEKLSATMPNSRLVVLPGQQHIAMDTAPDLLVREVMRFLTS
jgi:pimeloyl-ACP methyl ester carboxylesterase